MLVLEFRPTAPDPLGEEEERMEEEDGGGLLWLAVVVVPVTRLVSRECQCDADEDMAVVVSKAHLLLRCVTEGGKSNPSLHSVQSSFVRRVCEW